MASIRMTSSLLAAPPCFLRRNRSGLTAANIAARGCPTRSSHATQRCDRGLEVDRGSLSRSACCAEGAYIGKGSGSQLRSAAVRRESFRLHLPDAFPIFWRGCGELVTTDEQPAACTVIKFSHKFLETRTRFGKVGEEIEVVSGFEALAKFGIVSRRARVFVFEEFHRLALAFHDHAINQAVAVVLLARASRWNS